MTPMQSRMARAALGVPIREVAAAIGVGASAISQWERHGRNNVGEETIARMREWYKAQGVTLVGSNGVKGPWGE